MKRTVTYSPIFWLLIIGIIGFYFWILWQYALNIPRYDDYLSAFRVYLDSESKTGIDLLQALSGQHNEHRLFFNYTLTYISAKLFQEINLRWLIFIGFLSLVMMFFLFYKVEQKNKNHVVFSLIACLFLFQFASYETSFWSIAALSNYYVILFAFLSILFMTKNSPSTFSVAIVFGALSIYTQANGLAILVVGLFYWLTQVYKDKQWIHYVWIWSLFSIGILFLYFYNYDFPIAKDESPHLLQIIIYSFAFLGALVLPLSTAHLIDTAIPAISIGVLLSVVFLYLSYRRYFLQNPIIYLLMLFILGSALMAAIGRAGFGFEQAISSRYVINSAIFFICIIAAVLSFFKLNRISSTTLLLCAFSYNIGAYYSHLPLITGWHHHLLTGMQLFYYHQVPDQLSTGFKYYDTQILNKLIDKGLYTVPEKAIQIQPEQAEHLKSLQRQQQTFSVAVYDLAPLDYKGRVLARRMAGKIQTTLHQNILHIDGWHDIDDFAAGMSIYVLTPESATLIEKKHIEINRQVHLKLQLSNVNDVDYVLNNTCVLYISFNTVFTLFTNSPPNCQAARFFQQ